MVNDGARFVTFARRRSAVFDDVARISAFPVRARQALGAFFVAQTIHLFGSASQLAGFGQVETVSANAGRFVSACFALFQRLSPARYECFGQTRIYAFALDAGLVGGAISILRTYDSTSGRSLYGRIAVQ